MKRRNSSRDALGIGLSLMLAHVAIAQVLAQRETSAEQPPKNEFSDGPIGAVHKYVNAFNKGDATEMGMAFAVPGSILDGMAPHVWHGPTQSGAVFTVALRKVAAGWRITSWAWAKGTLR